MNDDLDVQEQMVLKFSAIILRGIGFSRKLGKQINFLPPHHSCLFPDFAFSGPGWTFRHVALSVCGLGYYFILASIPNGADPMVEVVSLFLCLDLLNIGNPFVNEAEKPSASV